MRFTRRFRRKSLTKGEYKGYNATYNDVLQDRIRHLMNYTRPTWYNKRSDPNRKINK